MQASPYNDALHKRNKTVFAVFCLVQEENLSMVEERIVETTDAHGAVVQRSHADDANQTSVAEKVARSKSRNRFSTITGLLLLGLLALGVYVLFAAVAPNAGGDNAVAVDEVAN
jgi:hypothetical protein